MIDTTPKAKTVKCWGCECGVPVRDGMHEESTDIPGRVYAYPCTSVETIGNQTRDQRPEMGASR